MFAGKNMDENDDSFGDFFKGFMDGLKPGSGRVRAVNGDLRYRQGGDPSTWAYPGAAKYLPGNWQMQCGSSKWTGVAATSGSWVLTYPVGFADNPVVVMTVIYTFPLFERAVVQPNHASTTALEVYWWSDNNLTALWVSWLALGPIAMK
jgi:hypothetical protein